MNKGILAKINLSAFFILVIAVFIYIFFKASFVPMTHDEVTTVFSYSKYSYWEIMMYPDSVPNNHILNTLLTKLMITLFGTDEIILRLPNVLSFALYSFGIYRILTAILTQKSLFFIPAILLFLMNPYLLDFFGLCRGYGMSVGLMLLSLSYLITSFNQSNSKHIWMAFVLATLASYANFTLLIFWLSVCVLTLCFFINVQRQKNTFSLKSFLFLGLSAIGFLALIITPILKMNGNNEFRFWTSNGFIEETIKSTTYNALYNSRIFLTTNFITYFILTLSLIHFLILFVRFLKTKEKIIEIQKPEYVSTIVLGLVISINIFQCALMNTPNLNGRTALFYYPLFITMLISMHVHFKSIHQKWIKGLMALIISFFGIHHLFHTATPYQVREWSYDAHTIKVMQKIAEHSSNQTNSIETHWLFNPSFHYYTQNNDKLNLLPYSKTINPNSKANYFYINDSLVHLLDTSFVPIKRFDDGNTLLFNTKIED